MDRSIKDDSLGAHVKLAGVDGLGGGVHALENVAFIACNELSPFLGFLLGVGGLLACSGGGGSQSRERGGLWSLDGGTDGINDGLEGIVAVNELSENKFGVVFALDL
eukprot:GEZU01025697.1.p2 GENE.GEZU01025697.1~~GEZU01025697.1.p2  ORF type:complete len:107 (-),score=19.45 GEZU01025697.1:294-614(-)